MLLKKRFSVFGGDPDRSEIVQLAVIVATLAAAWMLAWRHRGSFAADDWLPYAIGVAFVLAALLVSGFAVRPRPLILMAIAGLLAMAGWTGLSLTWSAAPALARDEALLWTFYAMVVAVAALTARNGAGMHLTVTVVAGGLSLLALCTAAAMAWWGEPLELFDGGRLYFPISYSNGQAAMFLIALWPAISLSACRALPLALRAAAMGGATALVGGWLLAQSRGAGLALVVSATAVLAVSPSRLRLLPPTLIVGALAASASVPLTAPLRAEEGQEAADAIRDAGVALIVIAGIAAVAGGIYALADRRLEVPPNVRRVLAAAALVALLVGVAAGATGFLLAIDRPVDFLAEKWDEFKVQPDELTATHLIAVGSDRYDFWRVALNEFREHPVAGIGARGYKAAYARHRRTGETPAHAHSLPLDALSQTGLIGLGLLALGLGALLVGTLDAARRELAGAGVFGAGVYWLTHTSVDWIWVIPAATVPALLLLGSTSRSERRVGVRDAVAVPAAIAVLALALVAFAPRWLAGELTDHAYHRGSIADTQSNLRWARRLDPLSIEPLLAEAALARSPREAVPPLRRAVDKEPRSSAVHYLLGLAYLEADRPAQARRSLLAARALNPREPLIEQALDRVG